MGKPGVLTICIENRKLRLENQLVRVIPFGTFYGPVVGVIHFLYSFQPFH